LGRKGRSLKKLILEQLLGEKPSILESDTAKSSIAYELAYQQESEHRDNYLFKYNYGKNTSRKLDRDNQLIFLRMFKALRKKYRLENQLSIAERLKLIFQRARLDGKFKYKYSPFILNPETGLWEFVDFSLEEDKQAILYADIFLKELSLSVAILSTRYNYSFDDFQNFLCQLGEIAGYIEIATPAAIIQMNKRLKKQHRK